MTAHPTTAPPADRGMRLLRAAAFSAVCVSASGCAHVLASGEGLSWTPLVAGWLATMLLVTPLAGRERSRPGIIATLLCGQVVLHVVFSLGQCGGAAAAGHPGAASAAHAPPVHEAGASLGASLVPGPAMFALHLVAAAVLGRVVHHGDRALWRLERLSRRAAGALGRPLAALLGAALVRVPALPPCVLRADPRARAAGDAPGWTVALNHAVIRRGPPVAA